MRNNISLGLDNSYCEFEQFYDGGFDRGYPANIFRRRDAVAYWGVKKKISFLKKCGVNTINVKKVENIRDDEYYYTFNPIFIDYSTQRYNIANVIKNSKRGGDANLLALVTEEPVYCFYRALFIGGSIHYFVYQKSGHLLNEYSFENYNVYSSYSVDILDLDFYSVEFKLLDKEFHFPLYAIDYLKVGDKYKAYNLTTCPDLDHTPIKNIYNSSDIVDMLKTFFILYGEGYEIKE